MRLMWFLANHPEVGVIGGLVGIGLIAFGVIAGRAWGGAE